MNIGLIKLGLSSTFITINLDIFIGVFGMEKHKIMAKIKQNHKVSPLVFFLLVKISSLFKVSFIISSYLAMFSATSIIAPLAGAFGGLASCVAVFGLSMGLKFVFGGLSLAYLFYHIPGLFASLYWASSSFLIRLMVPLACMVAFIAHPAIGAGWVYSLYWFIPVVIYFLRTENLFLQALGSTFTAHAVGSVVYAYADPMSPEIWLALIPVVIVERLIFASGMVIVYHVITYISLLLKKTKSVVRDTPIGNN